MSKYRWILVVAATVVFWGAGCGTSRPQSAPSGGEVRHLESPAVPLTPTPAPTAKRSVDEYVDSHEVETWWMPDLTVSQKPNAEAIKRVSDQTQRLVNRLERLAELSPEATQVMSQVASLQPGVAATGLPGTDIAWAPLPGATPVRVKGGKGLVVLLAFSGPVISCTGGDIRGFACHIRAPGRSVVVFPGINENEDAQALILLHELKHACVAPVNSLQFSEVRAYQTQISAIDTLSEGRFSEAVATVAAKMRGNNLLVEHSDLVLLEKASGLTLTRSQAACFEGAYILAVGFRAIDLRLPLPQRQKAYEDLYRSLDRPQEMR